MQTSSKQWIAFAVKFYNWHYFIMGCQNGTYGVNQGDLYFVVFLFHIFSAFRRNLYFCAKLQFWYVPFQSIYDF